MKEGQLPRGEKDALLNTLRRTLSIINSQAFVDSDCQGAIEELHLKTTLKLFASGLSKEVMKARYESNMGKKLPSGFEPKIVDRFPPAESVAGFIVGPSPQPIAIKRELLGRVCVGVEDGVVVVVEYFRPQGREDPLLFQVARKHDGISGLEGLVARAIPSQEAEGLVFSSVKGK